MRENLADDFVVFCALRDGAVVGFSLFQKYQGVLSGVRVGFDYLATTGTHAYFQLNYACPIRWAIENGYQLIDYGTEAYEAKLRRGGQLRRTMAYLAPRPCLRDQAGRLAAEQTARMALLRRSILGKDQ
jgi:predicted N-acyltransferase